MALLYWFHIGYKVTGHDEGGGPDLCQSCEGSYEWSMVSFLCMVYLWNEPWEVPVRIVLVGLIACCLLHSVGIIGLGAEILCTTSIVGDIVRQIAGEDIDVLVLLGPDTDPHSFQPRPQDLVALQRADLVFINGLDLEAGLSDILESIEDHVISLSADLPGLLSTDAEVHDGDHGAYDPHVWFDPTLVSVWVDIILDQLGQLVPSLKSEFQGRAATYQSNLAALDAWIQSTLEEIPADRRLLVTDHHAYGYFARRYGFKQVGTVFPGLSTLSEPSARELAELVSTIESLDIPAIFVGMTVNPSLAQQIALDTGTQVVFMYTGALSDPNGPAGTYLDFMRYTANAILEGLGPYE